MVEPAATVECRWLGGVPVVWRSAGGWSAGCGVAGTARRCAVLHGAVCGGGV
jgi:hypothetical protein